MMAGDIAASLGLFGTGLSQHARLITLATAQDSGLPESLMAEQFTGREAVNELFRFELDALSTSTELDRDSFIGEEITLKLLQADGSRRAWHGICTDAAWMGADGGVARYRLLLEPALALLRRRKDSYLFQDKNTRDIVTELLADYPQVRVEFDISGELAVRPICTQYRESDLDFLIRLLASEGLNWRFEHEQEGDPSDAGAHAKHRLCIFDSKAKAPAMPGDATLRFHGVRASDSADAIDQFAAQRQARPNAVGISSWHPAKILAPAAQRNSALDAGTLPSLAMHDGSGERRYLDAAAAEPHAALMLQALEVDNKHFAGAGAVRQLAAGHAFSLSRHERYGVDADRFVVLWVEHTARNNVPTAQAASLANSGMAGGTYRNSFACVRDTVALVPPALAARAAASAPGPQTALVVGLPGTLATTGRDHHVKIQFPWQRGAAPNPGGLAHRGGDAGNAPGNDGSGTWVRVAEALAGPNWGSQFTPRIGTEVLVDFVEGDLDTPLIVAQLYTGADTPPYAAGIDSGVNHAGTVSGIHSNNFDGGGYNQWLLDDTPGQVRTRLASSTAATQLNLGYLVQQAATSAQRGAYRGSGFELRSDAWTVLRAGEGMLISSTARPQQGSGIASTQFDAAETVAQLKGARALNQALADAAVQQGALASKDAGQAHDDLTSLIDPKQKGKYAAAVNGQAAQQAQAGGKELDANKPVEKFAAPIVLMEAPGSINWATPASTVLFSAQQLQWTSQGDLHLTAEHTVSTVAANAAGLFTHAGGIQAFAGNGPLSLQAHTDQLEILADKAITVISVNDVIEIKANQKITLQAGQSSVTLEGGNITFACPGNFTVKGGQHQLDGGANVAPDMVKLPDTRVKLFDEAFVLKDKGTGKPVANHPYRIKRADGTYEEGWTDEKGQTHIVSAAAIESLTIELLNI
ncbi:type VI secretion system secreted protein VgrG [Oxalobacteraceae bacterium GrIS 1.11]